MAEATSPCIIPADHCTACNLALFHGRLQATKRGRTLSFYTIPEYETWREEEGAVGWNIKYYKGKQAGNV